jgi:asparagine synthase (glutamine-hydrolysing)
MCGFAAIVGGDRAASDETWAMLAAIRHRGPDGWGVATFDAERVDVQRAPEAEPSGGHVALGHVRLSIIDLTDAGFQPMSDECGRVWTVFNGEIFNFAELRRELEARGHVFASQTDTEVIVHGWEEWGTGLIDRIEGMYALCIHDRKTRRTVLVRDRLGVKPLYWTRRRDGALLAASEVKALVAGGYEPRLDPAGIDSYLAYLWVPDPDTAFEGVKKVPPGHYLDIDASGAETLRRYWDYEHAVDGRSHDEHVEALRGALGDAIERQLVADVPLGAFFSGGLDSTAIVEMMRRRMAPERPACFTIGYSKRDLAHDVVPDDLRFARLYAERTPVEYHEATLEPDLVDSLPEVVWHMDEPVADPAALSAFQICGAASESYTVLLSGAGGDELFGGYPRYLAAEIARRFRRLPRPLRMAIQRGAGALPGAGSGRLAKLGRNSQKLLRQAEMPFPHDYLAMLAYFDDEERSGLYAGAFRESIGDHRADAGHLRHLEAAAGEPWLHQAMYLDIKTFLPALNLTYMDKMSMAHSIEVRVPLLDERVAEVMRRVPAGEKLDGRRRKALFKDAMRGIVPDEIIDRPKAGFGAPVRGWLSHELRPLVDEVLSRDALRARGMFEPDAVQRVLDDFRTGRRDTALQIWQFLTLELWQQTFIDESRRFDGHRRPTLTLAP